MTAPAGTRRGHARIVAAVLCLLVGATAGLLIEHVVTRGLAITHGIEPISAPVSVSADGRTLQTRLERGTLTAEESATTVTLTYRPASILSICLFGFCSTPTLMTRLAAPLGSRRLVDAAHGTDAFGSILRPTTMPPYLHHAIDLATLSGVAASYTQLYSGPGVEMSIVESWGDTLPSPSNGLLVRGHPAVTWSGHLAWIENGTTVTIGSSTYGYLAPTTAQLVAIANSMR
jgi:hypothetical protein